jgi:hypothetical protein
MQQNRTVKAVLLGFNAGTRGREIEAWSDEEIVDYYGTADGAYQSGLRAADEINLSLRR